MKYDFSIKQNIFSDSLFTSILALDYHFSPSPFIVFLYIIFTTYILENKNKTSVKEILSLQHTNKLSDIHLNKGDPGPGESYTRIERE